MSTQPKSKWGTGHASAWFRAGGKEAAQVLRAFPESIGPVEEPGLVGNLTPQEVMDTKQPEGQVASTQERSFVDDRRAQGAYEPSPQQGRERGMELGRDGR